MSAKRTWFLPTSPRSPEKLSPELRLLSQFENKPWDPTSQREFAKILAEAETFEGEASRSYSDFSARDRINRGPRALGFVRLPRPPAGLSITDAGKELLAISELVDQGALREASERRQRLFLHQLLKLQFPSPNHGGSDYQRFDIKPLRAVLEIVKSLDSLSLVELEAFCLPTVSADQLPDTVTSIMEFRERRRSIEAGRQRREFEREALIQAVRSAYAEEIETGVIGTRESGGEARGVEHFVRTKASNLRDYADATVRYFRACGLFIVDDRLRLRLLPERIGDVERIMDEVAPTARVFPSDHEFYEYLGNPELPSLSVDTLEALRERYTRLVAEVPKDIAERHTMSPQQLSESAATDLIGRYRKLETDAEAAARTAATEQLRGRKDQLDDVIDLFERILRRDTTVIDRPLFLEWNTWRAFQVIDGGKIIGNFGMDRLGQPTMTAPGRMPDIVCEYDQAVVVVEVTLQTGATQAVAEGEPVTRHVGSRQRDAQAESDKRPVIGLFLAPRVREEVIAHMWNQFNSPTKTYGGGVRVIPLDISSFIGFLRAIREEIPLSARALTDIFIRAVLLRTERVDELAWSDAVRELLATCVV